MSLRIEEVRLHPLSIPLGRAFSMSLELDRVAAEIVVEVETADGLRSSRTRYGTHSGVSSTSRSRLSSAADLMLDDAPGLGVVLNRETLAEYAVGAAR
jgi:hypothetical protein